MEQPPNQNKSAEPDISATQELLRQDPQAYWEGLHEQTMVLAKKMMQECVNKTGAVLNSYLQHMYGVIELADEELTLHRELETRIRNETLTDEQFQDWLRRIGEMRARISARIVQQTLPK